MDVFWTTWKITKSQFIPMNSQNLGFQNFDYIFWFTIKIESEIEKIRSPDWRIFEKNHFFEIETLTHNHVNTVSNKRNWTSSSDFVCDLVPLTEVWWCHDYVIWRNYENSIFVNVGDSRVDNKTSINICTYFKLKFWCGFNTQIFFDSPTQIF